MFLLIEGFCILFFLLYEKSTQYWDYAFLTTVYLTNRLLLHDFIMSLHTLPFLGQYDDYKDFTFDLKQSFSLNGFCDVD